MALNNVSAAGALARGHRILVLVARWTTALIQSRCRIFRGSSTAFALLLASTAFATTYYSYDSLGRVTQAVESNGTTTQYTYDADGNITSITRTSGSSALTIGAISTTSGAVGSSITINGSGFSSIPTQNTVTINGVAAQVTYASDNRLVITIPTGATTGDIEITTQNGSITSSTPLTVVPVSVSSFSPASAAPGTTVTLNGGGFDPTPANNTVLINGLAATVASATATQLQITVPSGATPGHISVSNSQGSGVSSADLFVPAPGYTLSQIAQVAVMAPAGTGHVYTINTNQVAVALFDGAAGQRMSFIATNLSVGGRYAVFAPDGSTLVSDGISTLTGTAVNLPPLSMAGTFALYFAPGSTPGTATFKLQTDVVGNLATDGAPTPTSLVPGQSATYTFSGSAGKSYNLALTQFTGPSTVNASIFKPDGSFLVNCGSFQAYYNYTQQCDFTVGTTGTYTLRIVPNTQGLYTSSFNTYVVQDVSATLTAGTPGSNVAVNLVANQHALLNFAATANQTLALYFGAPAIQPDGPLQFTLTGPGNSFVTRNSATTGQSFTWNLPNLAAGNYSVLMAPYSNGTAGASVQAALAAGVAATLPVNGSTSQFQTYLPGQAAYLTFAATAGQSVGLALSQLVITPTSVGSVSISIYKPDTGYYTSATCYVGATPGCQASLRNLPQTGNYQVVVTPNGQATMALAITLSQDQTGTLMLGTASAVSLTSLGQNAQFTFASDGTGPLVITGASIATSPANTPVTVYVYDSNNNIVQYTSMTQSGVLNLGILAAGTYSVLVVPNNAATASLQINLQPGVGGTLTPDGSSSNFATTASGQNAYFTFYAAAGQNLSVALTNLALSSGSPNYVTGTILNPDGTVFFQTSCYAGVTSCNLAKFNLTQTGTYSVQIAANSTQTMSFTITTAAAVTGTLSLNTPMPLNLSSVGQFAVLSFTATAGRPVTLSVNGVASSPAGNGINMSVVNSAGTWIAGSVGYSNPATAITLNLTNLASGTYRAIVYPSSAYASSMQVTLYTAVTGALTPDGSSVNFTTIAPGQTADLTFSGTAGQNVAVAVTNLILSPASPNSLAGKILNPDGSVLFQTSCTVGTTSCNLPEFNLPQTGTYHVQILPGGAQTMSFTATTSAAVIGTLSINTPITLNLSSVGQFAVLTFTATAGQTITLSVSGVTSTPAGNGINMSVVNSASNWIGGSVGFSNPSTSITLTLGNLAAGTYRAIIYPSNAYSSSMQVSYR